MTRVSGRYEKAFARLGEAHEGAFIPFVVLGDPDFRTSGKILDALARHADCLELGFPFSDPIADGKRIQAADQRALASGMTTRKCFGLIRRVRRKNPGIPIGLLVYYNLVYRHGTEKFLRSAKAAGADGILVADMPLEESGEMNMLCRKNGLRQIFIASPLSAGRRLERIVSKSGGFVYIVGVLGVTGERKSVSGAALAIVRRIRKLRKGRKARLCVGFGISKPRHAKELIAGGADGAIVGSAIEAVIEANLRAKKAIPGKVASFAAKMKKAVAEHA